MSSYFCSPKGISVLGTEDLLLSKEIEELWLCCGLDIALRRFYYKLKVFY